MSGTHAAVFHCPYCGEENLRPHETSHGAWACWSCARVFAVRLIGLLNQGRLDNGSLDEEVAR